MSANILFIDDNKDILRVYTRILENEGYNVVEAPDGYRAIEEIEAQDFDLAIVDINIPGPNGIEILKHVKHAEKDTEVIVISGLRSLDVVIEAMRQGAYDYIIKPFDIQTVLDAVARGLEKRRQVGETKQLLNQLEQKTFELTALYEIRDIVGYTLDYRELIVPTMTSLRRIIPHDASAFLFMPQEERGELTIWTGNETPGSVSDQIMLSSVDAFNSVASGEISVDDISVHERKTAEFPSVAEDTNLELMSFLNVALVIGDMEAIRLAGVINISSYAEDAFDINDKRLFYSIANNISNALEKLMTVLAGEKSKLEMMVGSMTDGVIMFDQRGHMAVLNPAAKKMLSLEGIVNAEDLAKHIGDTRLSRVLDRIWNNRGADELILGDDGFGEEIYLESPKKVLNASVSPIKSDDGRTHGIVALLRDITRRKEIDVAKSGFVSSVSHELRTPLTAIKNAISIIEMAGEVNEQQKKFLSICERNIERLGRLINDILDFSKLEDGKLEMAFSPVDLKTLTQESIGAIQELAERKSMDIILKIPEDLPAAYADKNRLDQVFTNILDNAIKYTPENGRITVEARLASPPYRDGKLIPMPKIFPDPGLIEVSVTDTGVGVSAEDQKRIFGRFEQAGQTYELGVGLGLSIVKKIIESHYGDIWIESELGRGSTFAFLLPISEESMKIISLIKAVDNEIEIAKTDHSPFSLIMIQMEDTNGMAEEQQDNQFFADMADHFQHNMRVKETTICQYEGQYLMFCLYAGDKNDTAGIKEQISTFIHQNKPVEADSSMLPSTGISVAAYPDDGDFAVEIIDALVQSRALQTMTIDQ